MNMRILCCICPGIIILPGTASAWWVKGHEAIATAAASRVPDEVPSFFRAGAKALGYLSGDPDRWKNRDAKFLRAFEGPDHTSTWKTGRVRIYRPTGTKPWHFSANSSKSRTQGACFLSRSWIISTG